MSLFGNRPASVAPAPAIRADVARSAKIDEYVASQISPDGPGLSLGIIKSGELVHAAGYGLANLNSRVPIAPNTIFHMASSGKQFTAVLLMMLAVVVLCFVPEISTGLPNLVMGPDGGR